MKVKISLYDKLFSKKIIISSTTIIGRGYDDIFNFDTLSRVGNDKGQAQIIFNDNQVIYKHLSNSNSTLIVHDKETYLTGVTLEVGGEFPLKDKDVIKIGTLKYLIRVVG